MRKFAVIWCDEHTRKELKKRTLSAFRRPGEDWFILDPTADDFLERTKECSGFIISGSPRSVVEDADSTLVTSLLNFIRTTVERTCIPIVGLCFGAQAIAAAMGGRVGRNPSSQFKLGVERLAWSTTAAELLGSVAVNRPTVLVESHGECITNLPPGGITLASSATASQEVFLLADRILGIQGHPEFDQATLRQHFMPFHRALFTEEQWARVMNESNQALAPGEVIRLVQSLLDEGRLPIKSSSPAVCELENATG